MKAASLLYLGLQTCAGEDILGARACRSRGPHRCEDRKTASSDVCTGHPSGAETLKKKKKSKTPMSPSPDTLVWNARREQISEREI